MASLSDRLRHVRQYLSDQLYFVMWRQKMIQAAYSCASILVSGIVLWLLAETNLECDYVYFFQVILLPSLIGSELFWQFLSARLTDTSPRHAKTILTVTSIAQITLDVVAFFFAKTSRWFVFVWFILRFAAQQQVGNSSGKILKMRIEWVLQVPPEKQLNYFNTVVVTGELMGRSSAVLLVYLVGVALGSRGYSFYTIRNVFFLILGMWDMICLTCTLLIPISYFLPEDRLQLEPTGLEPRPDDLNLPVTDSIDDKREVGSSSTTDYLVTQLELDKAYEHELELGETELTKNPLVALKDYFVGSGKRFWSNGPLFFTCLHLWTAFMLVSFVNIVLKFHVSDVGVGGETPTRGNLCAGQLLNVLRVGVSENTATLFGVLVYHFAMTRIKPYTFYNKIFVGIAVAFCVLFVSIFWKERLGPGMGSVVLGALYVGLYLVQTYDGNVASAWCDPTIIAFVFAMQASFAQVLALVPIAFAALKVNDTIVLFFCIMCSALLGAASFIYSRRRKQMILFLSDPGSCNPDELSYQPLSTSPGDSIHANASEYRDYEDINGDADLGTATSEPMREFLSPEDLEDD